MPLHSYPDMCCSLCVVDLSNRYRDIPSRLPVIGNRGVSSVEFALVLPMLLLILFGIVEFGWYMTCRFTLNHAVSEGARAGVAALEWEDEDPVVLARRTVRDSFWLLKEDQYDAFEQAIQATVGRLGQLRALNVVVSEWPYQPITGFLPEKLFPDTLEARSVMVFPR